MTTKPPPPIFRGEGGFGVRRSRRHTIALDMLRDGRIPPYWEIVTMNTGTRKSLLAWQCIEVQERGSVILVRLTKRGIEVRDRYAELAAEKASRERGRRKR